MKKVYLMRHSIAEKMDIPTSLIPLSEDGRKLAMSKRKDFSDVELCFSSSYKRAIETAELIAKDVSIVDGLQERIIGDAKVIMNGTFDPADYFEITFENNCPNSIKYCGKVNSSL